MNGFSNNTQESPIQEWWLTLVILTTLKAAIRRIEVEAEPGIKARPYLKKYLNQEGLGGSLTNKFKSQYHKIKSP
jgi:hypothetical protein